MSTVIVVENGKTHTYENAVMFHESSSGMLGFGSGHGTIRVRCQDKDSRWYDRAVFTNFYSAEQIKDAEPEVDLSRLRGIPLLDAAISFIEDNPATWNQARYRCGSGMCVAGHVDEIAGGTWAYDNADHWDADMLLANAEDDVDDAYTNTDRKWVISASDRARRLIGIDYDDAFALFRGDNTLEDIKRIRDELAEKAGSDEHS